MNPHLRQQQQHQRRCARGHSVPSHHHSTRPPLPPRTHLPGFVQTDTCHLWRIGSLRNKCLILCGLFTFNGRVGWEKHLICAHTRCDVWGHRNAGGTAPGCSFEINLSRVGGGGAVPLWACSFTALFVSRKKCALLDSWYPGGVV